MSEVDPPTSTTQPLQKTLPSEYYRSPEMYARERERIFCREWFCVGRETDAPNPGDSKVLDVLGESILLVRNEAGTLRGFYNVCRHRGAQLCGASLPGRATRGGLVGKRIRCPYHSWTYSLDGDLVAAPYIAGTDSAKYSLYPVGSKPGAALSLFISRHRERNPSPSNSAPFRSALAAIPSRIFASATPSITTSPPTGKSSSRTTTSAITAAAFTRSFAISCRRFAATAGATSNGSEAFRIARVPIPLPTLAQRRGRRSLTSTRTSELRHFGEVSYPNLFLSLSCDHVAAFILQPKGPERTLIECQFLFEPEAIARSGFDPSDAVELWDITNRQDWAICESVQRGIASRPHDHGYYAPMEDLSLDIRRYVGERLGLD